MRATDHDEPLQAGPGEPESKREFERTSKREEEEREAAARDDDAQAKDDVTQASEDSFPASDAPSWTPGTT